MGPVRLEIAVDFASRRRWLMTAGTFRDRYLSTTFLIWQVRGGLDRVVGRAPRRGAGTARSRFTYYLGEFYL